MQEILGVCIGVGLIAFVVWGLIPNKPSGNKDALAQDDRVIDPSDSYQIGLLIGLMGGSVANAATARFALQRFEEIHGRKATVREMGVVAGLVAK